jgi:hypothetical protein
MEVQIAYRPEARAYRYVGVSGAMLKQEPPEPKPMLRKIFWTTFMVLGLIADFALPIWWALGATIPIFCIRLWVAYRSDWFRLATRSASIMVVARSDVFAQ